MNAPPATISVAYDPNHLTGRLEWLGESPPSSIWDRLKARAIASSAAEQVSDCVIVLPWTHVLGLIREFGSKQFQHTLNFRFAPRGEAATRIRQFIEEVRVARASRTTQGTSLKIEEIESALVQLGFKRKLKVFQLHDLQHLLSLPHGANFSVPGAGKTTVTFALHLLIRQQSQHLFVVGPKSAFPAWREIVAECMDMSAPNDNAEPFTILDGRVEDTERLLRSGATRFLMSYDLMVRQQSTLATYFSRQSVHLVLDESHRMKAGLSSQRGSFLLTIANLPARRDILTGTPMPQDASDLASQLEFLWPGHGLDLQIQRGIPPRDVLGSLYVRTTKRQLDLPPVCRRFYDVQMAPGQMALYGIVRDESLRQLSKAVSGARGIDYLSARRSVMRLLQLSANPVLALRGMTNRVGGLDSGLVDTVLEEGASSKMRAVADHARQLGLQNQKCVIWTIFTDTILELERMLADMNPVTLYGAVPSGEVNDLATREGRLRRFHTDPECKVIIANPAAAGEGISLHTVCHNAIYLDRSYVSTHYLQSIDRIHRLGLDPNIQTFIHIYRTKAPPGIGSIDYSVGRRLAAKLRNLQQLLDDPDLHEIALDEETVDDPVDFDVSIQDMVDLIEELEGRAPVPDEEGS